MLKKSLASLVLIASVGSGVAFGQGINAKVTTILVDDVDFGGCMAALDPKPSTVNPNCKDPWVTFSCTGEFNSKSQAAAKLAAAQLALVTQTTFFVRLDDTKKHNGYCFTKRADNFRQRPSAAN